MSDSNAFDPAKSGVPGETAQPVVATDDIEGSHTGVDGGSPHEPTVAGEHTRTAPAKPHPGLHRV